MVSRYHTNHCQNLLFYKNSLCFLVNFIVGDISNKFGKVSWYQGIKVSKVSKHLELKNHKILATLNVQEIPHNQSITSHNITFQILTTLDEIIWMKMQMYTINGKNACIIQCVHQISFNVVRINYLQSEYDIYRRCVVEILFERCCCLADMVRDLNRQN